MFLVEYSSYDCNGWYWRYRNVSLGDPVQRGGGDVGEVRDGRRDRGGISEPGRAACTCVRCGRRRSSGTCAWFGRAVGRRAGAGCADGIQNRVDDEELHRGRGFAAAG